MLPRASFFKLPRLVLSTTLLCSFVGIAGVAGGCSGSPSNHSTLGDDQTDDDDTCAAGGTSSEDAGVRAGDEGGPVAATMNDVSILFPLPASAADVGQLLPASACGPRGTLLPRSLYTKLGPIFGSTITTTPVAGGESMSAPSAQYGALRLVALRLEPCFASLAPDPHGANCQAQLRLVLQEVASDASGGVTVPDSALHLFYALTRSELVALARSLVALRVASGSDASLGALAPHPVMVRQGLTGDFSRGVQKLVSQYAGAANLTRVAQLNFSGGALAWSLQADDVSDAVSSATTPFVIPTLPSEDGGVSIQGVTADEITTSILAQTNPSTTSADDLSPLEMIDDATSGDVDLAPYQPALDALVRIENPADNSANTIDCASCHLATPLASLVAQPAFGFDDRTSPFAFQPDGTHVLAGDMSSTFPDPGRLNLHAFSYVGRSASINQRVVNETAAVVEYLNQLPQ